MLEKLQKEQGGSARISARRRPRVFSEQEDESEDVGPPQAENSFRAREGGREQGFRAKYFGLKLGGEWGAWHCCTFIKLIISFLQMIFIRFNAVYSPKNQGF